MKKGKCKRCGNIKKIKSRGMCSSCYQITWIQEKKTGKKIAFPPEQIKQEQKSKSWADIQLETIVKENKIKRVKLSFTLSIAITNVEVTDVT